MSATNETPASSAPAPGGVTVNDLELPVFDYTEPRLEGEVYHTITTRAGEYAAEWTVQAMGSSHRALLASTPGWLRQRLVLRLARRVVLSTNPGNCAISPLREGTADVEVTGSIFCTVREPVLRPLCGFYVSALRRLFRLFDLNGRVEVVACRGTGGSTCVLKIALGDHDEVREPQDGAARPWRNGLIARCAPSRRFISGDCLGCGGTSRARERSGTRAIADLGDAV
jgi:hypothetical protein